MVNLAPHLLPAQRSDLLNLVPTLKDEDAESNAVAGMAPYFSTEDLSQALEMADGMADDKFRLRVVEYLAPYLPASRLPRALDIARSIRDRDARGQILVNLALALFPAECPLLPDRILEAADFIEPPAQRAQALYRLIPWLPEALHAKAWTYLLASLGACNALDLETALRPLTDLPEPVLDEVLKLIDKRLISEQISALLCLASRLPAPRLQSLIEGVFDMPLASDRAEAFVGILPYVTVGDRQRYLKALLDRAADGREYERADTIATLAPYLQGELIDAALAMAQKVKGDGYRAQALCGLLPQLQEPRRGSVLKAAIQAMTACQDWSAAGKLAGKLAPYLDAEAMEKALSAFRMIRDGTLRARALANLLPYVGESRRPNVAVEILTACHEMHFAVDRLEILIQIAPHLSKEVSRQEIVEAVERTQYAHQRARALLDALPFVPSEEWPQYLISALEIGSRWTLARERAAAWRGIIEPWQGLPEPDARSVWQHALQALAARPRPDLLVDLVLLVPILRSLGGSQALVDSIRALEEAATIWP
jgi:hypothetical protein